MKKIRFMRGTDAPLALSIKHELGKFSLAVNFFRWCAVARHLTLTRHRQSAR